MENCPNAHSRSMTFSQRELIDLQRYPIIDLTTDAARTLTRHCRAQLDGDRRMRASGISYS